MDIGVGEERCEFGEYFVEGLEYAVVADAKGVVFAYGTAGAGVDGIAELGTGEIWIRGDERKAMRGDIDLGEDGHKALGGVGNDLAHLVLGVEAAGRCGFAYLRGRVFAPAAGAGDAPRAVLGEGGHAFDLDAPALVVAEVEVQDVVFIADHVVDIVFDLFFGEEVTAYVEHEAAPAEAGVVGDLGAGYFGAGGGRRPGGDELEQGLNTVEDPGGGIGADADGAGRHLEGVAIAMDVLIGIQAEYDALFAAFALLHLEFAGKPGGGLGEGVAFRHDGRRSRQRKMPGFFGDGDRLRDDVDSCLWTGIAGRCEKHRWDDDSKQGD